jgi:hypothetical protein
MVDSVGAIASPVVHVTPTTPTVAPVAAQQLAEKPSDVSTSVTLNTATHITHVRVTDTVTGQLLFQIPDAAAASVSYPVAKPESPAGSVKDIIG